MEGSREVERSEVGREREGRVRWHQLPAAGSKYVSKYVSRVRWHQLPAARSSRIDWRREGAMIEKRAKSDRAWEAVLREVVETQIAITGNGGEASRAERVIRRC